MTGQTDNPHIEEESDLYVGAGTFSQEQVNAIVRDRLRRQRVQYEGKILALTTEMDGMKAELGTLRGRAEQYNAQFTKTLTEKRKDLPKGVLALLDKLQPEEQVAWLEENQDVLKVAPVNTPPETPRPSGTAPNVDQQILAKKASSQTYSGL